MALPLSMLFTHVAFAGFSIGMPGGTIKQVKKLDDKIRAKTEAGADPCSLTACTNVGGIISANSAWTLTNSPYTLTNDVQIASGITLTIDPGVTVYGNGRNLRMYGTLNAVGTNTLAISLNDVNISGTAPSSINIQFANIYSGGLYSNANSVYVGLKDSRVENMGAIINVQSSAGVCEIERNIFKNSYGIYISVPSGTANVTNNVFFQQLGSFAVSNGWDNPINVQYNSFLSTDRVALKQGSSTAQMNGANNYWNTTDTTIIDSMIYDKNDDAGLNYAIPYAPILLSPHPNTPVFP